MADADPLRVHEDPARFREAVNQTAAATGFPARLIEKDYYCSVLLAALAPPESGLVFKGGTCLAKVHAGFYRLSEDLDFAIPMPVDASRGERSRRASIVKERIAVVADLQGVRLVEPLRGANNSTQYLAGFGYISAQRDTEEVIRFEVGLREPLLAEPVEGRAETLLLDPVSGSRLVPPLRVHCLSRLETMAEKLRAALSRREPAIRDFYDLDYAAERLGLRLDAPDLLDLLRRKLAMPGNAAPTATAERLAALRPQLGAQLQPVLRPSDYDAFDLDRAFAAVAKVAAALG